MIRHPRNLRKGILKRKNRDNKEINSVISSDATILKLSRAFLGEIKLEKYEDKYSNAVFYK